jgi:ketosteroid isomerase-like protein
MGFAILVLVLPGAAPAAQSATVDDLLDADRAFDAAAATDGIEGWMSFMTADAARMPTPGMEFVSGLAAIRAMDTPTLDSAEVQLRWAPLHGHLFDDGRHGFTTGEYRVVDRASGDTAGTGRYLTFWRLTERGWKVAFDTGVADPPA